VILTGLSGAGKTTALHALEDLGYFTVDNLPPSLWLRLQEEAAESSQERVAVGVDVRTRAHLGAAARSLGALQDKGIRPEIVFLDAKDEVLVQRYNLTRRTHPLGQKALSTDITTEREVLGNLRAVADTVLDTSSWSVRELRDALWSRFGESRGFRLRLVSFGFKRGVPIDADNVIDLRMLPNPFYDAELRAFDGRDARVQAYVFTPEGLSFYCQLREFIKLLAGEAAASGRTSYTVALGCTGGQHRSVAVAERLMHDLAESFTVTAEHRDAALALAEHEGAHG
jgi:RNase adapter protein RapZ